jgi:hypothetical protein
VSSPEEVPTGKLGAITQRTFDLRADPGAPSRLRQNPGPLVERGPVPNVLVVQAAELGYPAALLVLMEPGDPANHRSMIPSANVARRANPDRQALRFPGCRCSANHSVAAVAARSNWSV